MPTRRKVVMYGDSLVLSGLGRSLERYPRFEVLSVDASREGAQRKLDAIRPAAVILDLSIVTTDFAFSLLEDRPDLLLIGLDPGGNGLLVLSGRQVRQLKAADLAQLIDRSLPGEQGEGAIEPTSRASKRSRSGPSSAPQGKARNLGL